MDTIERALHARARVSISRQDQWQARYGKDTSEDNRNAIAPVLCRFTFCVNHAESFRSAEMILGTRVEQGGSEKKSFCVSFLGFFNSLLIRITTRVIIASSG
jgi:hypothetical protein